MQTASDSLEYSSQTSNASAMIFQQEPEQVVGAASVYFASEDEATGVEYLLAGPEHDGIIDTLLDRNTCTFNVPKGYYLMEFSSKEPVLTKDARQGSLTEEDKTRERFLDGLSNDENYCCISCEDYLLDIELEGETPTLNDVTKDISCIGGVYLEDQLADSDGRNYGTDVLKLSDASTSSDHDSLPFDDMSTDKLVKVFREMFGWQTSFVDNQWVERHITYGLQNQDMWDKNFNYPKCSLEPSENEGARVPPASHENLLTASTAFPSVFNFRKMPRVQHVKRREHIQWSLYKSLSSAAGETQFDCPDKWDSKIEPALPFEDRLIRSEGHLSKDHKVNRAVDSDIYPAEAQVDPSAFLSDQSSDSTSEDDWTIGTETRRCNRKRKRNCWSTPEVLKLVEGVSKYGVGRWHVIKSISFGSSLHRSPTDLKDKWRNLVKASCRRSHKQRGVDAKQKSGQPSIPHHVLNRVRELAVIHPHSKLHRARVLPTVFVASPSGVESDNRCFSVNDLELRY